MFVSEIQGRTEVVDGNSYAKDGCESATEADSDALCQWGRRVAELAEQKRMGSGVHST
jgi:hypothetical protein